MKKTIQTTFTTRQYMVSKEFELYYYCDFDPIQTKVHSHDYYEFYFFLEGEMDMVIDGTPYPMNPGDMVLLPPYVKHHAIIHSNNKPYRRFVFWVSKEYCKQLEENSKDYVYLMKQELQQGNYIFHNDSISFNAIQSEIIQIIEEMHSKRFGSKTKTFLCANSLILRLNRMVYEQTHKEEAREEESLYQKIRYYLEEHLEEDVTLECLAREFYISKYHIAHVFKENIGVSIHQYLMKKRLSACKDAMGSSASISEVCMKFGFKEYSSFYRAFKNEYGISPKEYKEQIKKVHRQGKQEM